MRREPEGIEHETTPKSSRPSSALQGGLYDHSHNQEYDPYQSAARQMQELLFGTSSGKSDFLSIKKSRNWYTITQLLTSFYANSSVKPFWEALFRNLKGF